MTTVTKADMNLYEWLHKHLEYMPPDSLYYSLLKWKNAHPEVREALARKYDIYTVKWYDENDKTGHEKRYTNEECTNPYRSAWMTFQGLKSPMNENISCAEFWREANCYGTEMSRNSKLIDSFEREKD